MELPLEVTSLKISSYPCEALVPLEELCGACLLLPLFVFHSLKFNTNRRSCSGTCAHSNY